MVESAYVVVANAQNFATEVLARSKQVPVLVDFWADWCAPCKMLLPIITKLAEEYQGQFILAKVNSDMEQELTMEYGVRSLPTLKLFRHGKVVEEVMGVQPEPVLRAMIDRFRERPTDKLLNQAETMRHAGQYDEALALLKQAQQHEPDYHAITLDLAATYLATGHTDEVEALLNSLPANIQAEDSVKRLQGLLQFSRIAAEAPDKTELQQRIAADDKDLTARYQLSARLALAEQYAEALEQLLEIMRRDRKFADDGGRRGMVAIFELLGHDHELVGRYRSQMSRLLY